MLKRDESKKCTIPIRHHYETVPKIHIDASIWIFGIVMIVTMPIWIQSNGNYYLVLTAILLCKIKKACNKLSYSQLVYGPNLV